MTIKLQSPAFDDGTPIPQRCARDGEDLSPPLVWSHPPEDTEALALICEDPDAPRSQPFVHWVAYDIPPDLVALEEGTVVGVAGRNDWNEAGWGGPQPPRGHGTHRYSFRLYALDARTGLAAGASKDDLLKAMRGHVLDQGELMGTYEQPAR